MIQPSPLCPCWSGKTYAECCKRYHEGTLPENALALMRSRYSGYALGLIDYILTTTHPNNPSLANGEPPRRKEIAEFSKTTRFEGLQINEFVDGAEHATVTFRAILKRGKDDVSFTEKSLFEKVNGRWLYLSGSKT